ncbi:MAG: dethiobiotin synthase [Sulfuricurvum sp.]|uniref:dethiobiotin synthase n=1 Tax=Sulfuricurvum sp. TaxID=2025608 RepID=UPI0025EC5099|nr:dethiobiotin synthase [Sulfuricurvum sp.]MCK9373540.1 dethiobiotin synthase [Sulfuricurvum sp.]
MAKRIFITATNTDIGKTYTSIQLLHAFAKMGLRVGVYKPIETGVVEIPADGSLLFQTALHLNPSLKSLSVSDIVPLTFSLPAAPFVASGGQKIDLSLFDAPLHKIEALCDVIIIEGAGGLLVPIDAKSMMLDLPRYFKAVTLLITHCRLGCINDTLLSLRLLNDTKLPHVWGLNCKEAREDFNLTSLPYFIHHFAPLYFIDHDINAIAHALLDTITE